MNKSLPYIVGAALVALLAVPYVLLWQAKSSYDQANKARKAYADSIAVLRRGFDDAQDAVYLKDSTIATLTAQLDSARNIRKPIKQQVNEAIRDMHAAGLDSMQQRLWADPN